MVIITHYREKCIGCNACVEWAPEQWCISRKDGKSVLLRSTKKKGVYVARVPDQYYEANRQAARACPVKIIKVTRK
jgi:ferredoxin